MLNIDANSACDLIDRLRTIDISVPLRTESQTKEQCERRSVCRFLSTYAENDLLGFPLKLAKRERPDFLLSLPSKKVGIEITEATPSDWAWVDAQREKCNYDNLVPFQRFRPDEPRRSKEEIDVIARGEGHKDAWEGDSSDREWAHVMLHFAQNKAVKFAKPGYDQFDNNWLLICDNWPLPAVDVSNAAFYLSQHIDDLETPLPFDYIFVDCKHSIYQFGNRSRVSMAIRDLWKNS